MELNKSLAPAKAYRAAGVPWVFFTVMMSTVNIDPLRRSALLIVDMQNDFIDPKDGSLYVPGGATFQKNNLLSVVPSSQSQFGVCLESELL